MHTVSSLEEVLILCLGLGSVTFFDDPLQTIRNRQNPRVPILLGDTEDDGSVFASFFPNISAFYAYQFGQFGGSFLPPNLTVLYPRLNDTQVLSAVVRDVWFRWCVLRLLWVEKINSNDLELNKAERNYGVMPSSRAGSRVCTGTHMVRPRELNIYFLQSTDASAYLPRRNLRRPSAFSQSRGLSRLRT